MSVVCQDGTPIHGLQMKKFLMSLSTAFTRKNSHEKMKLFELCPFGRYAAGLIIFSVKCYKCVGGAFSVCANLV